jgi:transposase InsO family protein
MMESFFSSMQVELLDLRGWAARAELAGAVFEWVEAFDNPVRRHSGLGYLMRPRPLSQRVRHDPNTNPSGRAGADHSSTPRPRS